MEVQERQQAPLRKQRSTSGVRGALPGAETNSLQDPGSLQNPVYWDCDSGVSSRNIGLQLTGCHRMFF